MKAAYITETGGPDKIIYGDLPEPELRHNQYLIKVEAVDVNPVDIYIRSGAVPTKLHFPYILGRDLAGTIAVAPHGTKRFKVGDRVWCIGQGWDGRQGTFSELAAVDESWLNPTPSGVRDEEIAALSLVGTTAHVGLMTKSKLTADDTLFVNGGTGGVGSSVVQMAKVLGAKVITTAGSDEKVARARALGADSVINYKTQDVAEAVRKFAPKGVTVWWETLRQPDFDNIVSLLAPNGRIIIMAGRDARPEFPVGPFYAKNCTLFGLIVLSATPAELRAAADDINRWMAAGKLKAQIDRVMHLSQTAQAHRLQEDSTINKTSALSGKIILKP